MTRDGYGGRVGGTQFDEAVVNGLGATEIVYKDFAPGICAKDGCNKTYRPRREDDNYCSKVCEFDCYRLTRSE